LSGNETIANSHWQYALVSFPVSVPMSERVEAPMYLWDQDKARFLAEMLHRKHQEWQRGEHLQEFLVNRGVAWKVGLPAEDTPRLPSASDAIDDLFWFLVKKDPVSAIADLVRPLRFG
jgi:hypothetical protein